MMMQRYTFSSDYASRFADFIAKVAKSQWKEADGGNFSFYLEVPKIILIFVAQLSLRARRVS